MSTSPLSDLKQRLSSDPKQDLLGPVTVKEMTNKRARMKTWPILFVCQATRALHRELVHNYGTEALLLQWARFTSIQGNLATITAIAIKESMEAVLAGAC